MQDKYLYRLKMIRQLTLISGLLLIAGLTGCSSSRPILSQHEEFGETGVFTHSFPGTEKSVCEAGRRALLSQGYVISDWKPAFIKGRRKFQHDSEVHAEIEFSVVCVANSKGSNSTTVFANAVRDRYSLKKSNTSASIGVSALGSVSLPFGSTDDALVKVASETISTGHFYSQFFDLLDRYLDTVANAPEMTEEKKEPVPAIATPAAVPAPAAAAPELPPATATAQKTDAAPAISPAAPAPVPVPVQEKPQENTVKKTGE
ncbi:MAG: DUF2242 domain-containing protein [Burkholderiales bacterium]|nr:DUF2242 domain-containing protein [Burkholderiales bacterium]